MEELKKWDLNLTGGRRIAKALSSNSNTLEEEGAGKCLQKEPAVAKREK